MITYKGFRIYADNSRYPNGQHAARAEKRYSYNYTFTCWFDSFTNAIKFVRVIKGLGNGTQG